MGFRGVVGWCFGGEDEAEADDESTSENILPIELKGRCIDRSSPVTAALSSSLSLSLLFRVLRDLRGIDLSASRELRGVTSGRLGVDFSFRVICGGGARRLILDGVWSR